jgi:hypothetical protein
MRMYNRVMAKEVIHISEADAASTNVETLLAHFRAGAEVVIENGAQAIAVLRPAQSHPGRLLSESIAIGETLNSTAVLDGEFGHDLEAVVKGYSEPLKSPAWD